MTNFKKIICKINKNHTGQRLDQALTGLSKNLSRSQIKILLDNGNIKKSNKEFYDASYKVKYGEKFYMNIPLAHEDKFKSQKIPLDIIFEDEDIIVVNKKVGMVMHPAPGNKENTLVNALLHHTKNKLSGFGLTNRPGIVHRIDKDTSGLVVVAKNDYSHLSLSKQFKEHTINRKYHALVWGLPKKNKITGYIGRHKIKRNRMTLNNNQVGRYSETHIKIIKYFNLCSLIECKLLTGRTHQIRVHLSSINNPLVGDKVYGKNKINKFLKNQKNINKSLILKNFSRQALHAGLLGFIHPKTKKYNEFIADLPKDFSYLLDYLTKY
ncbi:MAG: RNA pseudouridine synthase [Pelagibacteraceae bacterium]|nr:RNA pseudouridine synthase [Pelagibacteraceae bacterium]|tara:strand:- start:28495 stop:29466 length:972 start_codon:yes stop_codon:yes gene_type:complete